MDLYRVLRISIYLLVASGAFADTIAEENPAVLIGVLAFGALAYATVDSRRMKPVRLEFAGAMGLALLVYTLVPLREEHGWEHFPAALAHTLCALEVLLFFTPFRGPLLLVFCGASLSVVILSGIIKNDISLVGRLICFITITSWTLFVHSLWRARESFNARTGAAADARGPERLLSERVFWQEMAMTGGMSALCLICGMLLYVGSPRLNKVRELINVFRPEPPVAADPRDPKDPGIDWDQPRDDVETHTGHSSKISLDDLNAIHKDNSEAMRIDFYPLRKELADSNGRLLVRLGAISEFGTGWLAPSPAAAPKDPTRSIADPSLSSGVIYKGPEFKQSVQLLSPSIHEFPSAGPIVRVDNTSVEQNEEGIVSMPKLETRENFDVWATAPPHLAQLSDTTIAIHDNIIKYVFNMDQRVQDRLKELALQITAHKTSHKQQIEAIVKYLRDPKNFSYTLHLDELHSVKDVTAIERFLLSSDPAQRRGHCVYFATAFVLLCRLNNIPARLAHGFSVDFPAADTDGGAEVVFRNSDSHAWGEVYFKDIGWVAFDPTPPEPVEARTPAPPTAAAPPSPPVLKNRPHDSAAEQWWQKFISFGGDDQLKAMEWVRDEVGDASTLLGGGSSVGWAGALLAWVLVLGFLAAIVYAFMQRTGRRLQISGSAVRRTRTAVAFYNDLLHVLSRRGFVRRAGQTPREFAELVIKRGGADFQAVLLVTEIFENVRYGNVDISQDDFNALQKSLDRLKEVTFAAK